MADITVRIRIKFQLTAARRRLAMRFSWLIFSKGFNSQPPEGGWWVIKIKVKPWCRFNSQPPEGGWGSAVAKT